MKMLSPVLMGIALTMGALPTANAADINAQYNLCVTEVKSLYGQETRVSLKKSKTRKGVTTLKLKVVPTDSEAVSLGCSSQIDLPESVVLLDSEGEPLVS
jgi:hypothetical protein